MATATGPELRKLLLARHKRLEQERASRVELWRELSDYIKGSRSRYLEDVPNSDRLPVKIINSTARRAHRKLQAGVASWVSSKAREWFRLTLADKLLAETGPVRAWLNGVEDQIRGVLDKSNVYTELFNSYGDMSSHAIAALHVEEDVDTVIRAEVFPIGQYCVAVNQHQLVDTVFRCFKLTVRQIVDKFGIAACSDTVQRHYNSGKGLDEWIEVLHAILPNDDYQEGKLGPRGKKWKSCWLEVAAGGEAGLLQEGGYEWMPTLVARWEASGDDVYGYCPGMDALRDSKALQHSERRAAQAFDKVVDPPMGGPASLLNGFVDLTPGAYNPLEAGAAGAKLEPLVQIHPQALQAANETVARHEARVEGDFFADLWLAFAEREGGSITAREVSERATEKLQQLGPSVERVQDELLGPLIELIFRILVRRGEVVPPPPELEGQNYRIQYISVVAEAQRLNRITAVDRLILAAKAIAELRPDVLDKLDVDEIIDTYGEDLDVPPNLLLPDDRVAVVRKERAAQQNAERQGQAALAAAGGAKDLASATMGEDNALNRMLQNMGAAAA